MAKVTMCSLSKGVQALLLVLSQHWHPASATTTCGKARIAKEEKNLGAWTAERLLRKEGEGNTRWMAEEGGFFVMDLGCQKMIKSIKVDNSQHLPGNKNQQGDGGTGLFWQQYQTNLSVIKPSKLMYSVLNIRYHRDKGCYLTKLP